VSSSPIGLAIWGLHHQHPRWYRTLLESLPQFALRCVSEPDAGLLAAQADAFAVDTCGDPAQMLARTDVEVVLVFVPHREMPGAVERCVEAGKHVLVEKPMGACADDARRVARIADAAPVKVTTGFYWRFSPAAGMIRRWVAEGLLGRLVHVEARFNGHLSSANSYVRDHAPWMLDADQGGAPMFNIGVHWVDLLWWLTGLEVRAVQGATNSLGEPRRTAEDNAAALLEYHGGALGLLDVGRNVPAGYPHGRDLFLSLRGTVGCVEWIPSLGDENDELLLVSEHESMAGQNLRRVSVAKEPVPGYAGQMGRDCLADFAEAVRSGRQVSITARDGLRAALVTEAVLRSARGEGRIVLDNTAAAGSDAA